jgi:hypothetical protein
MPARKQTVTEVAKSLAKGALALPITFFLAWILLSAVATTGDFVAIVVLLSLVCLLGLWITIRDLRDKRKGMTGQVLDWFFIPALSGIALAGLGTGLQKLDLMSRSHQVNGETLFWVGSFAVLFCVLMTAFVVSISNLRVNAGKTKYQIADGLRELDDRVFYLLPKMTLTPPAKDARQRILQDLLIKTNEKLFPNCTCRGLVLFPDQRKQYLEPWATLKTPGSAWLAKAFVIRRGTKPRGVASTTFRDGRVHTTHIDEHVMDGRKEWRARENNLGYIPTDGRPDVEPGFCSLLTIPALTNDGTCVGVICLDSLSPTAFDAIDEEALLTVGKRAVAIRAVYEWGAAQSRIRPRPTTRRPKAVVATTDPRQMTGT